MEPLGFYQPWVSRGLGLGVGLFAAVAAASLFELSRQLADKHKGRWYAGNGRDVFHAGAAVVVAGALVLNGLPTALAFALAATSAIVPLMVLDWIAAQRTRLVVLLVSVAAAMLPALIAPKAAVDAGNAVARTLFAPLAAPRR